MDAAALSSLGIVTLEMPTPFPQAPSVNAYLLAGRSPILIDAGIDTPEAWDALVAGLASAGVAPEDIGDVYLTHGHVDHYGLARRVSDLSGARVHVHPLDKRKVTVDHDAAYQEDLPRFTSFFLRMGVPAPAIQAMGMMYKASSILARQLPDTHDVVEGPIIPAEGIGLDAVAFPGHTPGLVCYYDRAHRILFTGDHLLPTISPSPILEIAPDGTRTQFRGLAAYMASMDKAESMEIDVILPGHGRPIVRHRDLIATLRKFLLNRQDRILAILSDGALTPHGIVTAMFPRVKEMNVFLAISEIVGALEILEDRGTIRWERRQDGPDSISRV